MTVLHSVFRMPIVYIMCVVRGRIALSPSVFGESGSLRYCPVSMYLTVIALNLADFGLVVVSQRICRFQFICDATIVGC